MLSTDPLSSAVPTKPQYPPLYQYCLRVRQSGWYTPLRSEKSPRPLFYLTNSSQPNSLTNSASHAMYSPSSYRIAVSWGQERVAWAPLLLGAVIDSPRASSRRGRVWNIIEVDWGGTGRKPFTLLLTCQPPDPSSPASDATATASTTRGGTWGGDATPRRLVELPPLLSRVFPRMGLGRRRPSPPPPPHSYPRMTFMAHAMSDWSPPGGYGKLSPALLHLELHAPLIW